jgi:predicted negative regulator of RcsB-dependent stress response
LGIGSPRVVTISLSTSTQDTVLTSETVNSQRLSYFVLKPAGGWYPEEEFFTTAVPSLVIQQQEFLFPLEWKGQFSSMDSTVLLAFSRDLRLNEPFEFSISWEEDTFSAAFEVPPTLWPGYNRLEELTRASHEMRGAGRYRTAIASIDTALSDPELQGFPQLTGLRNGRTALFVLLANVAVARLDSMIENSSASLEDRVSVAASSESDLSFAADSLQARSLGILGEDPATVTLALRLRTQAARAMIVRDSLQQQLDRTRIRWILEKGNHSKNGLLYSHMIEAIAYAFSSIDFFDTTQSQFSFELPPQIEQRLKLEELTDDYQVFLRVCNDRHRLGVPIFPVGFLPSLRKDTAKHVLPLYYMLQGVADYWSGNYGDARTASLTVLRKASDSLIASRFDMVRMATALRLEHYPEPAVESFLAARQQLALGDTLATIGLLSIPKGDTMVIAPASLLRGQLQLALGDTAAALGQYASAWQTDGRAVDAYLMSATIHRQQGRLDRAAEVLRLAVDNGNKYWIVYYALGITSLDDNMPSEALRALETARTISARSYETIIALGRAHQATGDLRRARDFYNRAITIDPLRTEAVDFLTKLNKMNRPPR